MSVINQHIKNQQSYIKKKMAQPLLNFTNQQGEQAKWDDIAVQFTDADGRKMNLNFVNNSIKKPCITRVYTEEHRLPKEAHDLLFAYALDTLKKAVSINVRLQKIVVARQLLGKLHQNIALTSNEDIQSIIDGLASRKNLREFFNWLHQHKMIPQFCDPDLSENTTNNFYTKSGDDAISHEKEKLPDEKCLIALGAIFHDVIPPYKNGDNSDITHWASLTHSTLCQRDAFTCTMSVLAMSSPNRAGAEQTLLTKQRLSSITEVVNGKEETVYYLNWRGSKGYLDNQKHFNGEMAESLDRVLHYIGIVTEPARVLARFYKNPKRPLKEVLGVFVPSEENLAYLNPQMDKPTTLIHLGLLLGYFDNTDKMLRVQKRTKGAVGLTNAFGRKTGKYIKPIADLSSFDELSLVDGCEYTGLLHGSVTSNLLKKLKDVKTVADLQNYYVSVNQENLSGLNHTINKPVVYEDALFAFTERQLNTQAASHFLLVPIMALTTRFEADLNAKSLSRKTIFLRHGFSDGFELKPHQLRHWQNDYLDKKNLPHMLISLLSGRKDPEQTLTYTHSTDTEKASTICGIMFDENETVEEAKLSIHRRLQSQEQYEIAIENLSPTFVSEVGFCVQNLLVNPCNYMNDFDSQCALCSSSCHVAHDEDAICNLKDDLMVQQKRLEMVEGAFDFASSRVKQAWFLNHYKNTSMLKELINVMTDEKIKEGSVIRLLADSNVMRINDLDKLTVTEKALALPSPEDALKAIIDAKSQPEPSPKAENAKQAFLNDLFG